MALKRLFEACHTVADLSELAYYACTCRWEDFTDAVVRVLAKKQHLVYLLWGNPAQQK
jgi:uracil DNA glycosylase